MKNSIEYLINEVSEIITDTHLNSMQYLLLADALKRAREKHKEEIINARLDGFKISGEGWNGEYPFEGKSDKEINIRIDNEGYYNQTYNQNNQNK